MPLEKAIRPPPETVPAATGADAHKAAQAPRAFWRFGPPTVSRSLQLTALVLLIIVSLLIAGRALEMRRDIIEDTSRQVARLDMVFAEQTGRAVETIDFLMHSIAEQASQPGPLPSAETISRRIAGVRQLLAIDLTDAQGRIVASSRAQPGEMLPEAARSLIEHASPQTDFGLQISAPIRGPDGRWAALMLRRRPGEGTGFVVGAINLAYFEEFYKAVDLSENGAILLHRRDGTVLARYPAEEKVIGTSYADLPPFRDILSHDIAGTVEMASPIDGAVRILAIRALRAFPLAVNVSVDEGMILRDWRRQNLGLVGAVVAVTLMIAILLLVLARRTREVERLLGTARAAQRSAEAANGNLIVQMEERERAETDLRQAQRVEAVGQLTGGVAHDFNNLLTVILGNIELLQNNPAAAPFAARLATIRAAADRGANLTGQMLAFARRQPLMPRAVDMNALITGMTPLLQSAVGSHVTIRLALDPEIGMALVDPTQLELVILNLAINARDAMPKGGTLRLGAEARTLGEDKQPDAPPPGVYICLSVQDSGIGMTEDVLARVFEPFFTTKGPAGGSGLGLSQVYGVARQSGGKVSIDSAPGAGTTVSIYLPRTEAVVPAPPAVPPAAPQARPEGRARLLVVDDDVDVLATTALVLRRRGYEVKEANNARDALSRLEDDPDIDLLLTDMVMPDINGPELARRARALRPTLPIVFFSGYADPESLAGPLSAIRLLRKPFRPADLSAMIDAALEEALPVLGG
jgi:signal transduction histidine kinase